MHVDSYDYVNVQIWIKCDSGAAMRVHKATYAVADHAIV